MRATSLSRPAFYQYFRSRYDIAAALVGQLAEATAESARRMFDTETDPVTACDAGIRSTLKNLAPHAYVVRALMDAAAADARVEQIWREAFIVPYTRAVTQRIMLDEATGATPSDIAPELMARALFVATAGFIYEWPDELSGDQGEQLSSVLSRVWCASLYGEL